MLKQFGIKISTEVHIIYYFLWGKIYIQYNTKILLYLCWILTYAYSYVIYTLIMIGNISTNSETSLKLLSTQPLSSTPQREPMFWFLPNIVHNLLLFFLNICRIYSDSYSFILGTDNWCFYFLWVSSHFCTSCEHRSLTKTIFSRCLYIEQCGNKIFHHCDKISDRTT